MVKVENTHTDSWLKANAINMLMNYESLKTDTFHCGFSSAIILWAYTFLI